MLSQYSWGQFFLFVVLLVILYYVVVGLIFYRDGFSSLLVRKGGGGAQLAGAGAGTSPPTLVRSKSAFVQATPAATESSAKEEEPADDLEAGAAQNLPTAAEPAVSGKLPASSAAASGQSNSLLESTTTDSFDEEATDDDPDAYFEEGNSGELDQAPAQLAERLRQKTHAKSSVSEKPVLDELALVYEPGQPDSSEPLATFTEPVASSLDVVPAESEELFSADSITDYIAQLRSGQEPTGPAALAETNLGDMMAKLISQSIDELTDLFGEDD